MSPAEFHASDFNHMRATVQLAKAYAVQVGAHPSLPDRQGFGRREMKIGREELANCLIYQIGALKGFLEAEDMPLNHIKPHGSLYGMAARDPEMAHAVCDAADVFKTPLLGMIGTEHEEVYTARGHRFLASTMWIWTTDDGKLIITREHEAVDRRASTRCSGAARRRDCSVGGKDIKFEQTRSVHSDTPAHLVARAVHDRLVSEGFMAPRSKKH
jgi:UPF0271 protein